MANALYTELAIFQCSQRYNEAVALSRKNKADSLRLLDRTLADLEAVLAASKPSQRVTILDLMHNCLPALAVEESYPVDLRRVRLMHEFPYYFRRNGEVAMELDKYRT